jgi:DNA-binding phage protein
MARGFLRINRTYRTYSFRTKNPVIDKCRTIVQDAGLYKNLGAVAEISGLARGTIDGWFFGDTKNPQHASIMALVTSLGFEERFVKVEDINVEKERQVAREWLAKQERKQAPTNGVRKTGKKK